MKKRIIAVVLTVIIIVVAYLYAHIDKNTYLYDRNTDSSDFIATGILRGDEQISQTFVCQEEHLDGLNIKVSVNGNVEDIMLRYSLVDDETKAVYEGTVKGGEIENNKLNQLKLEKISNAKGKTYTFILQETGADEMNGIGFFMSPESLEGEKLVVKGNETQGTLIARTITHRFDLETFFVFLGFVVFIVAFMKILYKLFK